MADLPVYSRVPMAKLSGWWPSERGVAGTKCLTCPLPDQAPEGETEVQKESPWRARLRYAQIGGAAVAGGALLAVTGIRISHHACTLCSFSLHST